MTARPNRHIARGAAAALLGSLAAAAAAVPAVAAPTAAAAVAAAPLRSQLLDRADLPKGWQVIGTAAAGGVGCLSKVLEPAGVQQTASAKASFRHSGGSPELYEKLATFASATSAYGKMVADLRGCHRVSGDPDGNPTTGTVVPISFTHLGSESQAFDAKLDVAGLEVDEVYLVVLKGSVVLGLSEASLGKVVDLAALESVATTAVRKIA
jgi:hypothetical protein